MSYTENPGDPRLRQQTYNGMHAAYLVMPDFRRNLEPARPVRHVYTHRACGEKTRMSAPIARSIAHDPRFYDELFCVECKGHFPVKDADGGPAFSWAEDNTPVGGWTDRPIERIEQNAS